MTFRTRVNPLVNALRSRAGKRLRFVADRLDPDHAPRWSGYTFVLDRDSRPIFHQGDRRAGCMLWYLGHDEREKALPIVAAGGWRAPLDAALAESPLVPPETWAKIAAGLDRHADDLETDASRDPADAWDSHGVIPDCAVCAVCGHLGSDHGEHGCTKSGCYCAPAPTIQTPRGGIRYPAAPSCDKGFRCDHPLGAPCRPYRSPGTTPDSSQDGR